MSLQASNRILAPHSSLPNLYPGLAELIAFFQQSQHSAQNRLRALKYDPLAVPRLQDAKVRIMNQKLRLEMIQFDNYIRFNVPEFDIVYTYLTRIAAIVQGPQ